jgi:PDZ domain-containing protein
VGVSAHEQEPERPVAWSRRSRTLTVGGVALLVLTCLAAFVPVPYATMKPGPVFNTLGEFDGRPLIEFGDDVTTYDDPEGTLSFTTVSVSRASADVSLFRAVAAALTPDTEVVPRDLLYPEGTTQEQSTQESAAQLAGSKSTSAVAALRALGKQVSTTVVIASVVEDGPSDGVLEADDRVLAVGGTAVTTPEDAVKAIGTAKPGDDVTLTVQRDGRRQDVTVTTEPAEDDPDRALVGVTLGADYDLPVDVTNNVGEAIGGPSAGTMFALAIYDKLTPGSLTAGRDIAGTGTIDAEGTVGPIGGVKQKIAGADAAGAEVFLVPAANCAEAAETDHDITLVKIEKLAGAVDALEALAKDPDAEVPTCE